ncbi:MAG: CPBP family intramembrane metalloprotease [Simkaniaceae bacterium]|nr:CPBP family intramembrane metalloprotease [Simkaniaceae bacterium]
MEQVHFSFNFFSNHPIFLISYALMLLTFISFWIKRTVWLWAPLLVLSFATALNARIVSPFTIFVVVILLACHLLLHYELKWLAKFFLVIVTGVISLLLNWHLIKGFSDVVLARGAAHSIHSLPYDYIVNYGTPFIGVFILALNSKLIEKRSDWGKTAAMAIPYAIVSAVVLVLIGFGLKCIGYDFKFTPKIVIWAFFNLILQVIPEEAFYRDYLQKNLRELFPSFWANVSIYLVIAFFFALTHFMTVPKLSFAILSFIASLLYSGIYQLSGRPEGSMMCRFIVNIVHFWFFTYPIIAQ